MRAEAAERAIVLSRRSPNAKRPPQGESQTAALIRDTHLANSAAADEEFILSGQQSTGLRKTVVEGVSRASYCSDGVLIAIQVQ